MGRLPDADAVSQHSLSSVVADDLPPPYSDIPDQGPSSGPSLTAPTPAPIHLRLVDSAYALPDSTTNTTDKTAISLAPALSRNSNELFHVIRRQMKLPPRPLFYIKGTHTESGKKKDNNRNNVVDFDFKLDLAETMLTGWEGQPKVDRWNQNWVEEEVLNDQDYKPAFRGGRMKSRTYTPTGPRAVLSEDSDALLAGDAELGIDGTEEQPGSDNEAHLKMWCKRFCSDPSPVKSFTLHRTVSGFDAEAMRNVLDSHIRELNYHGSLSFSYNVAQQSVTVYSPHWINRMRANRYIWWIFVILQLWIISWPIIWAMEKRYELAYTRWYTSLGCPHQETNALAIEYASGRAPAQLAEYWANAVKRAAWSRRCGDSNMLTRMDAERTQGLNMQQLLGLDGRTDSQAEQERRARVNNGNAGFVDHMVGFVRGVGEVSQDWRLTMGWGNNS